jgi:hypothetical protein
MSKSSFISTVENLFSTNAVSQEVRLYFETTVKAKKVNKKEVAKANTLKSAILDFLVANAGTAFDRTEIGNALWDNPEIDEKILENSKQDGIAYNSITAFANQLVANGDIVKFEVKVGKSKKVKYQAN